LHLLWCLWV